MVQLTAAHPFDEAIALTALDADRFGGHTSQAYWNMVGPFGGITAATVLQAVMQHPSRLGEPVALTVNYASALVDGPFTVTARAARTNRSTQHWVVEVLQTSASGADETVLTATVLTAVRRPAWSVSDMPMPAVAVPQQVSLHQRFAPVEWVNRYEIRAVSGAIPQLWDGSLNSADASSASLTQLWVRDQPPRPLDFCALAAYADVFYPRIYLRRATWVAAGTVSMTVYFHASAADLAALADGFVLAQARAQVFHAGFFDQTAQLWSSSGRLLVTSLQIVYYKE